MQSLLLSIEGKGISNDKWAMELPAVAWSRREGFITPGREVHQPLQAPNSLYFKPEKFHIHE